MRTPTTRSLTTAFLLLVGSAAAHGQPAAVPAPAGTGVIAGRVTSTDGPMMGVTVSLSGRTLATRRTTTTDEQGAYTFADVREGQYLLNFERAGFVRISSDRDSLFGGATILLAPGESRHGVNATLARWGVIVAHVSDDLGNPAEGVSVGVLALKGSGVARTTRPAQMAVSNPRFWEPREFVTNDHGEVRLYGLAPGEYIVVVEPFRRWASALADPLRADHGLIYPRIYYPGTPSLADARGVHVSAAEEISVNVVLLVTRAAHVSGRVVRGDGQPGRAKVHIRGSSVSYQSDLQDGRFTFWNLPPGDYVLETTYDPSDTERDGNGSVQVTVGADDVTDVVLTGAPENDPPANQN